MLPWSPFVVIPIPGAPRSASIRDSAAAAAAAADLEFTADQFALPSV